MSKFTSRRELLQILTVGTAGGLAGCSLFAPEDEKTTARTNTPSQEKTQTPQQFEKIIDDTDQIIEGIPPEKPNFAFEYGELEIEETDSRVFERVLAKSASNAQGDRLRIIPNDQSVTELAQILRRTVWNVQKNTTVKTKINGGTVQFSGGMAQRHAFLVGTGSVGTEKGEILATRAYQLDTAISLAKNFSKIL